MEDLYVLYRKRLFLVPADKVQEFKLKSEQLTESLYYFLTHNAIEKHLEFWYDNDKTKY